MKLRIWNDEILAHSSYYCFNRTWYKLDEEGYYYCTNCDFRCPSLLITLPKMHLEFQGYFTNYGHPYGSVKAVVKEEIFDL